MQPGWHTSATTTLEFTAVKVETWAWWMLFGQIRPELIHDACWGDE